MAWEQPDEPVLQARACQALVFNIQTEKWPAKLARKQESTIWWDLSYFCESAPVICSEGMSKTVAIFKELAIKLDLKGELHVRGKTQR